jgi:hypothetical protein
MRALYVLTKLEEVASILDEVSVELVPLTASILSMAEKLRKPKRFRGSYTRSNYAGAGH